MRYVLSAQDHRFFSSPQGESLKALVASVPASVWESLDKFTLPEYNLNEETVEYQSLLIENCESILDATKTQRALFYAKIDEFKIRTKEEYDKAVQEAFKVYEGLWDLTKGLLSALTEGGSAIGIIQFIIDLISLVPGSWVGFPIDVVANVLNGIIYLVRELYFMAILSFISAIPGNYMFKGLKISLNPFAKILNKFGLGVAKADPAVIKAAVTELKAVAGVDQIKMLTTAMETFAKYAKGTLIGMIKKLGSILESILSKIPLIGVKKGVIADFVSKNIEVPFLSIIKGSDEAILAFKEGDQALLKSTEDALTQTTRVTKKGNVKVLTQSEQDLILNKVKDSLTSGNTQLLKTVTELPGYQKLLNSGANAAQLEVYTNNALRILSSNDSLSSISKILKDKDTYEILVKNGWSGDLSVVLNAINSNKADVVKKVFDQVANNPKVLQKLTDSQAALIKVYSKYPEQFILNIRNVDNLLESMTKLSKAVSYRSAIMKKVLLFSLRQIAKIITTDKCYKLVMQQLSNQADFVNLKNKITGGEPTTQPVNEAQEFDVNSKEYKEARESIIKQLKIEPLPENEPEINKLTIEVLKKAKDPLVDCGLSSKMTDSLNGALIFNPGLGGKGNEYGQDFIDDEEFKGIEQVINSQLNAAGIEKADVTPVNSLTNSDPMVSMYYSDVVDPKTGMIHLNTSDQSRLGKTADELVKLGKIKATDKETRIKEILDHWGNGTEPAEVTKQISDSTKANESFIQSLLSFDKFKI